jgi:hypothetical protein
MTTALVSFRPALPVAIDTHRSVSRSSAASLSADAARPSYPD